MADIVVTVPNSQIGRTIEAMCIAGGYAGDPEDQPARREFARRMVRDYIRQTVMQVERQQAFQEATSAMTIVPVSVD